MNTRHLSHRARIAFILSMALALGSGASFAIWAFFSSHADGTAAQSGASSRAQSALSAAAASNPPAGNIGVDEASMRTEAVLTAISELLSSPEEVQGTDMSTILSGQALDEFNVQIDEWAAEGMHQEGRAFLESPQLVDSADDDSSFTMRACVDSSNVRVFNDAGVNLRSDHETRWLTDFTFVLADGVWKLDKQTFPKDPKC